MKNVNISIKDTIKSCYFNIEYKNNFLDFLRKTEIELMNFNQNFNLDINVIYIAGEKLTRLNYLEVESLLLLIKKYINLKKIIEYNFECYFKKNFDLKLFDILKKNNINRLVWKIKSFAINDAEDLIIKACNFGFSNFSIDLQYNLKNQSKQDIIFDLEKCIKIKAPHISYESSDDSINYQFKKIIYEFLKSNKYINYEFFSFALENYYSNYVLSYYYMANYYGIGPDAVSFFYSADDKQYLIKKNNKITKLSYKMYYQIKITQGLMLAQGFNLNEGINQLIFVYYEKSIKKLIDQKLLKIKNNNLLATSKGWHLLNKILIDIINS